MARQEPSLEEWQALYAAAVAFRDLRCWEWLWDSDSFGVTNPETGEVGYCSVMGALGEYFGLGVYPGPRGYASLVEIQKEFKPDEPLDLALSQFCLMASFQSRSEMAPEDFRVIKSLGLKFRGKNAWPLLRIMRPHRFPWFLDAADARFLTVALEQAAEVGRQTQSDRSLIQRVRDGSLLVRVPVREGTEVVWAEQRQFPPEPPAAQVSPYQVDELRLTRIRKGNTSRQRAWEIAISYSPTPVASEEGPYLPALLMAVDADSGLILAFQLSDPDEAYEKLPDALLSQIEELGFLPETIRTTQDDVLTLLRDIASGLSVRLERVGRTPVIENVLREMRDHFGV